MTFVVLAERTVTLQPERIRRALDTVQQEHALLQTRISWTEDTGLRFEPVTPTPWASEGEAIEPWCHSARRVNASAWVGNALRGQRKSV